MCLSDEQRWKQAAQSLAQTLARPHSAVHMLRDCRKHNSLKLCHQRWQGINMRQEAKRKEGQEQIWQQYRFTAATIAE